MWGNPRIVTFLGDQRDLYKYIHDQSVNLMNKGYTGTEIADTIQLPPSLAKAWYNRGYYGSVKHDSRAVYQRYMGFYDGNPSTLDQLPPEPAAKKYVEYMGGPAAVLQKAKVDFDRGEYRWVAEAVKQVVFADPGNTDAKHLLADTYEQLGYQAESGPWRSIYLMGAHELRNGVPKAPALDLTGPDTIKAMPPDELFDYWGVRLNGPKAAGKDMRLGVDIADLHKQYTLTVRNGALTTEAKAARTPRRAAHAGQAGARPHPAGTDHRGQGDRRWRHQGAGRQEQGEGLLRAARCLPVLVRHRHTVTDTTGAPFAALPWPRLNGRSLRPSPVRSMLPRARAGSAAAPRRRRARARGTA